MVVAQGESESDKDIKEGTDECMMAHQSDLEILSNDKVTQSDLIKFLKTDLKMNLFI